jgi:hypothetical protein
VTEAGDFEQFVACRSAVLLRTAYLLRAGDRGAAEDLLPEVLDTRAGTRGARPGPGGPGAQGVAGAVKSQTSRGLGCAPCSRTLRT